MILRFIICMSLICLKEVTEVPIVTVIPREDTQAVLHNPDMGWIVYENYPLDQRPNGSSTLVTLPDEDFPDVDNVAIMFSWADIERREGEYDFSKADYAYDYWRKRGKQIQLRMSTESLLWWTNSDPPSGKGIPDYVLDRLPPDKKQIRRWSGIPYVVVDARDPFYLERLKAFLKAVSRHFSGERRVTLVDLRGFGLWGEWHSGYRYESVEARREALIRIIDLYSEAFKENYVALSYSYDPDSPKEYYAGPCDRYDPKFTTHYADYLYYSAFDYALRKDNVTFRRDGVGGAVHSNERRLCEEAFRIWRKAPMVCEFVVGYRQAKQGGREHVTWFVEDALSLHPNYINLLGWQARDARDFLYERPDLIAYGLRNMGYRLLPTRVRYPGAIRNGEAFSLEMEWVNRGVGRALQRYELRVLLADTNGKVIGTCRAGPMETNRWIKGKSYPVVKEIVFRDVPPGRYELRLMLVDPRDGRIIALPLVDRCEDGSYRLGTILVR